MRQKREVGTNTNLISLQLTGVGTLAPDDKIGLLKSLASFLLQSIVSCRGFYLPFLRYSEFK